MSLDHVNNPFKILLREIAQRISYAPVFIALFFGISIHTTAQSQNPGPVQLRSVPLNFDPNEFYIAGLIDQRQNRNNVAWLIPSSGASIPVAVDLQGGGKTAIENYLLQSLPKNKSLRPVIVRLKECTIIEKLIDRAVAEGQVSLDVSFELLREGETIHLLDFDGGLKYKRSVRQFAVIEPSLRRVWSNALNYFQNWMEKEAPHNIQLVKGVKINFTDYTQNVENDTIFYDRERPIKWSDFKGRSRPGKYAASIFTSFSYEGNSKVVDGYLQLDLEFKVYMLKQSSWVRDGHGGSYGLNHEQRHFDITRLVVERFKKNILALDKNPEDYDSAIQYQYIESYREMNRLQDEYDLETGNGQNKDAQERWNKKIEEELKAIFEG